MNNRIAAIQPSVTLGITSKAKRMKAEGLDVCSFAAGEPDFDTPQVVKSAAIDALNAGHTKYAPVPGLPQLRQAIADKLGRDNGLEYAPEQIVVSNGGKHSLFNVCMALCNPGDEVIIPTPYWLSYPEMVKVPGGVPVFVQCDEDNDFKMTPAQFEAAITEKSVAVILNSPSNPIGTVYSGEELAALAEIAVKHDLIIISDEIYEKLVYDGVEHVSVASLSPEIYAHTITANGFSKCFSMTGWRLGYLAGPLPIIKAISAFQSHTTSSPNTFAQYGALKALSGTAADVAEMVTAFSERRHLLYDRLSAIDGIHCVKPGGAFYMLPNISSFGLDSVTFADRLLDAEKVAVIPGVAFGADGNVRLSYACGTDTITEGTDRLARFCASLR